MKCLDCKLKLLTLTIVFITQSFVLSSVFAQEVGWPADEEIIWPSDNELPVCIDGELAYHDHPTLWVVVEQSDGSRQVLTPFKDLGIKREPEEERCFREIHTHDNSGRLHVESVINERRYQLRHFLTLWESAEPEKVKLIRQHVQQVTVFDVESDEGRVVNTEEMGTIRLVDDRKILIVVGMDGAR